MKRLPIRSFAPVALAAVVLMLATACVSRGQQIAQYGGMREVLREGQSQARVTLAYATARPHAYAVGAMAGLAGEVTIADSFAIVSRVREGALEVGPPELGDRATLLTLAYVERWCEATLAAAAGDRALELSIEVIARAAGVNTSEPFPFLIEGELTAVEMHVINGVCPLAGGSDEAGPQAPYRPRLERPTRGTLIGFYATGREGEMTHHGARTHMHSVLEHEGRTITGHVESVIVAAGARVRVPDTR